LGKKKIRMRMCVLKMKILVTIYSREREMRRHRGHRRCEFDRFPKRRPAVPERAMNEATLSVNIGDFRSVVDRVITSAGRGGSFERAFGPGS
jgi:hypothetical protein